MNLQSLVFVLGLVSPNDLLDEGYFFVLSNNNPFSYTLLVVSQEDSLLEGDAWEGST